MQQLSDAVEEETGLEITVATIGKIESGVRGAYDWEVAAFARALGVSSDWLLSLNDRLKFKKQV